MSDPKIQIHPTPTALGGGTICNPVVTVLKVGTDKTLWPGAAVSLPVQKGSLSVCQDASVTWVLAGGPDASVHYQILQSDIWDLQGQPTTGTLNANNPILQISVLTADAGVGGVVFSGSDPATSVVIVT